VPELKGFWIPHFLRERRIRTALQNLYVAVIGSRENARILLKYEPDEIGKDAATGNPLARRCFDATVRWLRRLQEFSITPEIFSDQFLKPFRVPARFILRMRDAQPSTTCLDGLVFRRSRPFYDRYFGENMLVLSIAIPQLGVASSLRCRVDYINDIDYGFCRIDGIQPLPFVNRIHPSRLRLEWMKETVSLSDFNFLKVSFQDLLEFQRSLAFENLCEIWSEQSEDLSKGRHGRRLGAVCIFGGLVRSAGGGPYMILEDPCKSGRFLTLYVTEQFLRLLNTDLVGLRNLKGRLIRVLGVVWFRYGSTRSTPEYPEVIVPEFVNDRFELIMDDLIGFVRVRDKVISDSLIVRYRETDFSSLPQPLTMENGYVTYNFSIKAKDNIVRIFLDEENFIRSLRRKTAVMKPAEAFIMPEQLLNTCKLQLNGLAERIKRDKHLLSYLLALIRHFDHEGALPSTLKELTSIVEGMPSEVSEENFRWLRDLGLLSKRRKKPARITGRGIKIAYLAIRENLMPQLKGIIRRKNIVDLLEMENETSMPASLLLQALQELENERFARCISLNGQRCELFWMCILGKKDAAIKEAISKIELWETEILGVLSKVHYALHISKILEEIKEKGLNMNYPALRFLLLRLKKQGRLIEDREHGMWFYPLENRIIDILSRNRFEVFTPEEIAEKASIPLLRINKILKILEKLKQDRKAVEILDGKWAVVLPAKEDIERKQKILKSECRRHVLNILKKYKRGLKPERLNWELIRFLISVKHRMKTGGSSQLIAAEVINEMLNMGEIVTCGKFIKLPENPLK